MASNLTKGWIQYLKNNQIVALQSDPKSGKLNYKKPVTTSDVVHFLQSTVGYDDNTINQAIDQVMGTAPDTADQSRNSRPQLSGKSQSAAEPGKPAQPQSKYAATNNDVEDVEDVSYRRNLALGGGRPGLPAPQSPQSPQRTGGKIKGQTSQTPSAIRKRQARADRKAALNEDFVDNPGEQVSEKQVEAIFNILVAHDAKSSTSADNSQEPSVDPQQVRVEEVNKLKRFIRDTMSEQQRMSLWRALQDE